MNAMNRRDFLKAIPIAAAFPAIAFTAKALHTSESSLWSELADEFYVGPRKRQNVVHAIAPRNRVAVWADGWERVL